MYLTTQPEFRRIILKAVAEKAQTNYMQTIPDSHFWSSIEMLLNFLNHYKNGGINTNYLIIGLQNTLNRGYQLTSPDQSQEAQKQGAEAETFLLRTLVPDCYNTEFDAKESLVHVWDDILLAMEEYAAQPAEEWVAVEDGLPEEGGRYWCYCESVGELGKSYFQWNCAYDPLTKTFHDFAYSFKDGERVTHWMPLPAPPSNQNK